MAHVLYMPRLTQSMSEGQVLEWLKLEGDEVEAGEQVVSVEGDKAMMELMALEGGVLRKILVQPGETVEADTALVIIAAMDEDIVPLLAEVTGGTRAASPAAPVAMPEAARSSVRRQVSPVARRLAGQLGVALDFINGTGPGGLVTEADVRAFAARAAKPAADEDEVLPLTGLRRQMAERMALSRRMAADVTTVTDVDVTDVAEARKRQGFSYTAYVAWAAARALREFPILNASLVGDRILIKKEINLGVAVALDDGLRVTVIRGAGGMAVAEMGQAIDGLAERARAGKLTPAESTGSTFTVTNSGVFGSLLFTPIINPPEVAILGMGKVADTPAVRGGQIVARKIMYLCLSYDHRVVEGKPAVQFLQSVKHHLERIKEEME